MTTMASEVMPAVARQATRAETRAWAPGFRSLETEIVEPRELEVRGAIPRELEGALYRNGSARHDVYGDRFVSWFDGDGMVHKLAISGGRVTYQNRFVATPGKIAEDRAGRRLYAGFATRAPGGAVSRFLHRNDRKNPGNTNVVVHAGKLLALCEGGRPYRLDPATLATIGEDDMGGALPPGVTYSAHPKLDRESGEMWNFGVAYGKDATIDVYRTTKEGETTRAARLTLPFGAMVHDFALTRTKAVFVVAPLALPRVPVGLVLGQRSFGESLRYRPELGTRIAVVDRATGEARWLSTDPFVLFHVANAWDEGDDIVVDICAYPDGSLMQTIKDVMAGDEPTPARAWLDRLRLSRSGAVTRTRLSDTAIEFPRVKGSVLSSEHTKVYGVAWTEDADFIARPAVIDVRTGKATLAPSSRSEYAGECIPVSKPGARSEEDVWLLTLVLDGATRTTELRVLDGADLGAPAVATVRLPHVVPFGFHGNWVPAAVS